VVTFEVSSKDWQEKVLSAKTPVVVDFWAPWCPWCMKLMPVFEEVSKQYDGRLIFAKVNAEEEQGIAQANGVMGIPVLKVFCDGRNIGELVGYMPKEKLVNELDKILATFTNCLKQSSALRKEVMTE
jgi:thioredoxin 1